MKRKLTAWLLLLSMLTLLLPAASFAARTDVDDIGSLQIMKEWSGLDDVDYRDYPELVVDVYDEDGNIVVRNVPLTPDQQFYQQISLPVGNYTVKEREESAKVDGYDLIDVDYDYDNGRQAVVEAGESTLVTITNTYEELVIAPPPSKDKVTVEVYIDKTFSGKHATMDEVETFEFTITDEDGKVVDVIEITVENGDPIGNFKSLELDPNETYYITETKETLGTSQNPHSSTIFTIDGDSASNKIDFSVTKDTKYVEVSATNVYEEKKTDDGNNGTGLDFDVPEIFSEEHDAYISGYPDGTVQPSGKITRAEVASILYRLLKPEVRAQYMTTANGFSDVKSSDWFNTAVSTVSRMGVISGYPDGTFRPNNSITRAELAALTDRFFEESLANDAISFKDLNGHWAQKEVISAASRGLVSGYEDGTFHPNQSMTRAEAVTLINRITHRLPQSTADLLTGMVTFPDNRNTSAWYYLGIQEAANSHDYERKTNGFEKWVKLR